MKGAVALLSGTLFGFGLALSGMTNPANVLGFLALSPLWQPALAFVMGSALLVTVAGYRLLRHRARPWLDAQFYNPASREIDARLLTGASLFGLGWGLSGYCPGPAIVGAWTLEPSALMFLGAYLLGNLAHDLFQNLTDGGVSGSSELAANQQPATDG